MKQTYLESKGFRAPVEGQMEKIKDYLENSQGMTINELLKKIEIENEEAISHWHKFLPYEYRYYDKIHTATIRGTIKKCLDYLIEDKVVVKTATGRYVLRRNIEMIDGKSFKMTKDYMYRNLFYENGDIVEKIVSPEEIESEFGKEPNPEEYNVKFRKEEDIVEKIKNQEKYIERHLINKPLIFGKERWGQELNKLRKELEDFKNELSKTREFKKIQAEYRGKVVDYVFEKTNKQDEEKRKEKGYWTSLTGFEFEREVSKLLKEIGFEVKVTKKTGDGGIDIIASIFNKKCAIQCKAHKNEIGPSVIRELKGVIVRDKYDCGFIIALNKFSSGAVKEAKEMGIKLVNIEKLIDWAKSAQNKNEATKEELLFESSKNMQKEDIDYDRKNKYQNYENLQNNFVNINSLNKKGDSYNQNKENSSTQNNNIKWVSVESSNIKKSIII